MESRRFKIYEQLDIDKIFNITIVWNILKNLVNRIIKIFNTIISILKFCYFKTKCPIILILNFNGYFGYQLVFILNNFLFILIILLKCLFWYRN